MDKPHYVKKLGNWYRFLSREHYARFIVYAVANVRGCQDVAYVEDPVNITAHLRYFRKRRN